MRPRSTLLLFVATTATPAFGQSPPEYVVSQLDPSSGQFVEVGRIQAYCTEQPAADYYNFTGANPSFTDPAPALESDTSHLFLVESTVDGLCLGLSLIHI